MAFAMSPSALNTYKQCKRKFVAIYNTKEGQRTVNKKAEDGRVQHQLISTFIEGEKPLIPAFSLQIINSIRESMPEGYIEYSEIKMGVTEDLTPVEYNDKSAILRAIIDYVVISPQLKFGLVIDWKTGRVITYDLLQLYIAAIVLFSKHPELDSFRVAYAWTKHELLWPEEFKHVITRERAREFCREFFNGPVAAARTLTDIKVSTCLEIEPTKNKFCSFCEAKPICFDENKQPKPRIISEAGVIPYDPENRR